MKKVGIIMGSDSDLPVVEKAFSVLEEFEVPYEVHVYSAHRTSCRFGGSEHNPSGNRYSGKIIHT